MTLRSVNCRPAMAVSLMTVILAMGTPAVSQAAQANNPSGLPVASGVAAPDVAAFQNMRGKPLDVISTFPSRGTWAALMNPWWMDSQHIPDGYQGNISVAMPLWPEEEGSLEEAAAGKYNQFWTDFGRMVAARFPDAYIRLGWEMNVSALSWHATPDNVAQWRLAFRHAAIALKSEAPGLQIVFNPNVGTSGSLPRPTDAYAGSDVVDVIGVDHYDWYPADTSDAAWEQQQNDPYRLNTYYEMAQAEGKKFAIPEWGVSRQEGAGGDNPKYINDMFTWMRNRSEGMAYESYFNLPEPAADAACREKNACDMLRSDLITMNPASAGAYREWMNR